MRFISNPRRFWDKIAGWWDRIYDRLVDTLRYVRVLLGMATLYATIIFACIFIYNASPDDIKANIPQYVTGDLFTTFFILTAFFLGTTMVSAYVIQDANKQRRRRHSYRYDQHSTLYGGEEPNIAFRIPTFQGMLERIGDAFDHDTADDIFVRVGKEAANNFSLELERIMNREFLDDRKWEILDLNEKLYQWSKYDSGTGWGLFVARCEGDRKIIVRVSHYHGLFNDEGGRRFAHFLAGYCQTVLSAIVSEHKDEKFSDNNYAHLTSRYMLNEDTVEFTYRLEEKQP